MDCQKLQFCPRQALSDPPGGIDAVKERHRDSQDDEVGFKAESRIDQRSAVADRAHDLVMRFEDLPEPLQSQKVLVSQQNTRAFHEYELHHMRSISERSIGGYYYADSIFVVAAPGHAFEGRQTEKKSQMLMTGQRDSRRIA